MSSLPPCSNPLPLALTPMASRVHTPPSNTSSPRTVLTAPLLQLSPVRPHPLVGLTHTQAPLAQRCSPSPQPVASPCALRCCCACPRCVGSALGWSAFGHLLLVLLLLTCCSFPWLFTHSYCSSSCSPVLPPSLLLVCPRTASPVIRPAVERPQAHRHHSGRDRVAQVPWLPLTFLLLHNYQVSTCMADDKAPVRTGLPMWTLPGLKSEL